LHRIRTCELSRYPLLSERLKDVVGLIVDPNAHAVGLSVDEKSEIQPLHRTQPGLSLTAGRPATRTHDDMRHGTTLFPALNVLKGTVLGRRMQRHRHQEFIRFLNAIEAAVPAGRVVHVILDNFATHKHPTGLDWLLPPPAVCHLTPTACSWLNAVETFFAALTKRRLRGGVFYSIVDLQAAIHRYIAENIPGEAAMSGSPTKPLVDRCGFSVGSRSGDGSRVHYCPGVMGPCPRKADDPIARDNVGQTSVTVQCRAPPSSPIQLTMWDALRVCSDLKNELTQNLQ
jgi:transposase